MIPGKLRALGANFGFLGDMQMIFFLSSIFVQGAGRSAKWPGTRAVCTRWSSVRQAGLSASGQGPKGQGPGGQVPVHGRSAKLACQQRARDQGGRCPLAVGQPGWPVSIGPGTRGVGVRWWSVSKVVGQQGGRSCMWLVSKGARAVCGRSAVGGAACGKNLRVFCALCDDCNLFR